MALISDNEDEALELLEQIVRNTTGDGGDDVTINQEIQQRDELTTGDYYSSGKDRVEIDNTDWDDPIEFGLEAKVVSIRTTDDVVIAFGKPHNRGSRRISVRASESPFSIGSGGAGINTEAIWVRKRSTANSNPEIEVIAYR